MDRIGFGYDSHRFAGDCPLILGGCQVPHPRGDRLLWHQPAVAPLRSRLRDIDPEIVHAHMAGHYADAALRSGKPALITLHGVVFREASLALAHSALPARARWLLDAAYERWIVGRAKDLVAISPYVAKEYRKLTGARFHAIENPVDDRFFGVAERTPEPDDATFHLLCPARVIPRKDIMTLLRLFALVRNVVQSARLEIAGQIDADPAYMLLCRQVATELGINQHVRFLGNVGGEQLLDAYGRAHLVLLTSRQETAPEIVAEAMAAGRVVVATRVGGVPAMVSEGHTGLLAEAGDARGLADAVIALLADPARRARMAANAQREAGMRFQLQAVVTRTIELYRSLCQGAVA